MPSFTSLPIAGDLKMTGLMDANTRGMSYGHSSRCRSISLEESSSIIGVKATHGVNDLATIMSYRRNG